MATEHFWKVYYLKIFFFFTLCAACGCVCVCVCFCPWPYRAERATVPVNRLLKASVENFSSDPVTPALAPQQPASRDNLASNYLSARTCTFSVCVFPRDSVCLEVGVALALTTDWLLAPGPWRQCHGEVNQTISTCKSIPRDPRALAPSSPPLPPLAKHPFRGGSIGHYVPPHLSRHSSGALSEGRRGVTTPLISPSCFALPMSLSATALRGQLPPRSRWLRV